jgi:hypothetical protein
MYEAYAREMTRQLSGILDDGESALCAWDDLGHEEWDRWTAAARQAYAEMSMLLLKGASEEAV